MSDVSKMETLFSFERNAVNFDGASRHLGLRDPIRLRGSLLHDTSNFVCCGLALRTALRPALLTDFATCVSPAQSRLPTIMNAAPTAIVTVQNTVFFKIGSS